MSTHTSRCIFLNETDKAIQVQTADGKNLWLPKSQIKSIVKFAPANGRQVCEIEMSEWIAKLKGLLEPDDESGTY